MNFDFQVTPQALSKLAQLAQEQAAPKQFRIYVQGGGCSGLRYRFVLEPLAETPEAGETRCGQPSQCPVVFDAITRQYLEGAQLHHHQSFQSSSFQILQPHLKGSCRCGSSFAGLQGEGGAQAS